MQRFLSFIIDTIERGLREFVGIDYSLMTAAQAEGHFYRGHVHPWHAFGHIQTSPTEHQLWGFGLHLLVSRLHRRESVAV